jgi:hypothetical protein
VYAAVQLQALVNARESALQTVIHHTGEAIVIVVQFISLLWY